jgi:hypothetical protein
MKSMHAKWIIAGCTAGILTWAASSQGAPAILTAAEDTYVEKHYHNLNYGKGTELWVWPYDEQTTLLRFRLSKIRAASPVTNAVLTLYLNQTFYAAPIVIANAPDEGNTKWIEGTGTAVGLAVPGASSWDWQQAPSLAWIGDRGPAGGASIRLDERPTDGLAGKSISFLITNTAVLTKWVERGQVDIVLSAAPEGAGRAVFSSREGAYAPTLRFNSDVPASGPKRPSEEALAAKAATVTPSPPLTADKNVSRPRLLNKTLYYEGQTALDSAFYTRRTGFEMMTYSARSEDNGLTWVPQTPAPDFDSKLRKGFRRGPYVGWVDPVEDKLLTLLISLDVPDLDSSIAEPPVGESDYYLRYRVSVDGGKTFLFDDRIIQSGAEYNDKHPLRGTWTGKNGFYLGDAGSRPLRTKEGLILIPTMVNVLGPDGKLFSPGGGFTYHDTFMLIGKWRTDSRISWDVSDLIQGDPTRSTRGMIEPTIAEMPNGKILCVMRGSNGGSKDSSCRLPSYKWHSISSDGGRRWSKPQPWGYSDGTLFYSPSAMSQLLTHSNGKVYWIGNICAENAKENFPRYPLVMGQVDPNTLMLIKPTVIELDNKRAEDSEGVNLSHVLAFEDRKTSNIILPLTRYNGNYTKHTSVLFVIAP